MEYTCQGNHKGCPYITALTWSQGMDKVVSTWCGRPARAPIFTDGLNLWIPACAGMAVFAGQPSYEAR